MEPIDLSNTKTSLQLQNCRNSSDDGNLSGWNGDSEDLTTVKTMSKSDSRDGHVSNETRSNVSDNIQHRATFDKGRVKCRICSRSFADNTTLSLHINAVHLKSRFNCTVAGCPLKFSFKRSRDRHSANPNPKLHLPNVPDRHLKPGDGRTFEKSIDKRSSQHNPDDHRNVMCKKLEKVNCPVRTELK